MPWRSIIDAYLRLAMKPYKLTLFDRHGPAAGNILRAWSYGAMVFAVAFSASLLIGHRLSFVCVVVSALLGATVTGATFGLSGIAGAGFHRLMVSGASTPYEEQFSYQESLVMRGQVDDALASYEAIIAERAEAVTARHPGTDAATRAKLTLAELKEQMAARDEPRP